MATSASEPGVLAQVLERWQQDAGATYQNWFHWEERLKNFRSIRRGLQAVVQEIESGSFGNAYRGSSLETPTTARKPSRTSRFTHTSAGFLC